MDDVMKKKILALLLAAVMSASMFACGNDNPNNDESKDPADEIVESNDETTPDDNNETVGNNDETVPDEIIDDPESETTPSDDPDETKPEETPAETPAETEPEEPEEPERIYNYLTGYTTTLEERNKRPVAIMINNIKESLPQPGLCSGEVYYECAAEGGVTRIMMLASDYASLPTVGSIRSSRDYFIDFIASHDPIYVHAGGSEMAYEKIYVRYIDNLDGVNMGPWESFWRDEVRLQTMSIEHTMMTSGPKIAQGVKAKGYRTTLEPHHQPVFKFFDENTDNTPVGSPATHVHMKSTSYQTVDFVYNEKTGEYLRYQYNGQPHVDGTTGEQLSVKNVLILFTDISVIPGDAKYRLKVVNEGSGQGYYITNGQRKVVNWSKETERSNLHLEYRNGDELILNCGKTFICVVDKSVSKTLEFEYKW